MTQDKRSITQVLLRQKIITENDLQRQGNIDLNDSQIMESLLEKGSVTQELVALVTSNSLEIAILDVTLEMIDWEEWDKYPSKDFGKYKCVPIFQGNNKVLVVMAIPLEEKEQNRFVKLFEKMEVTFAIAANNIIPQILQNFYERLENQKKSSLSAVDVNDIVVFIEEHVTKAVHLKAISIEFRRFRKRIQVYYRFPHRISLQEDHPYVATWSDYLKNILVENEDSIQTKELFLGEKERKVLICVSKDRDYFILHLNEHVENIVADDTCQELLSLPAGFYLLVHPNIWDINQFASRLLSQYSEKGYVPLSICNTKNQESANIFELSLAEFEKYPEVMAHIKPNIAYLENFISPNLWSYVTCQHLFLAVPCNNATDAFLGVQQQVNSLFLATRLMGIVSFAQVNLLCTCMQHIDLAQDMGSFVGCKECSFTGYTGKKIITEIIKLDKDMRKMVWDTPNYEEVKEKIKPHRTLLQKLSTMLKNNEIMPNDVSPFI